MLEIVMVHNVKKDINRSIGPIADYAVTIEQLEDFILARRDWLSVSPTELENISSEQYSYLLTFDDGYLDNMENALPVLEQYELPCILFCTTGFISGNVYPYEAELADVIENHQTLNLLNDNGSVELKGTSAREEEYQNLRLPLKDKSYEHRERYMEKLAAVNEYDRKNYQTEQFLSWSDIKELSAHPLVTIGTHTVHHEKLAGLPLKKAYNEITKSKQQIEDHINKEIHHFSYPYGSNSLGVRNILRLLGFCYAYNTKPKKIESIGMVDKVQLPRIDITRYN